MLIATLPCETLIDIVGNRAHRRKVSKGGQNRTADHSRPQFCQILTDSVHPINGLTPNELCSNMTDRDTEV